MDILIALIVYLAILGILYWLVMSVIPLPAPLKIVAQVVFAIIAILMLVSLIGWVPGWAPHHWIRH